MSTTKEELVKHQKALAKIAENLGLQGRANLEERIIQACTERVAEITARLSPERLPDLLQCVAAELGLRIVEVENRGDIDQLLKQIPPSVEPAMARIPLEFDDETDAMVIKRLGQKSWEPPYLAVINAMGWHRARRYFSKWHEISHLLAEGRQLDFAFRKTPFSSGERLEPLERIIDNIAGSLAFYPPIFHPALKQALGSNQSISFGAVEKVRNDVIPEASMEATTMACMKATNRPMLYVRAAWAHKKSEARKLEAPDLFPETLEVPEKKLRVAKVFPNAAASKLGFRLFRHMSIPAGSLIEQAFKEKTSISGSESASLWPCDSTAPVRVECRIQKDDVVALLSLGHD